MAVDGMNLDLFGRMSEFLEWWMEGEERTEDG